MKTIEIKWRYVEIALITILSSIIVLDIVYVVFSLKLTEIVEKNLGLLKLFGG